MKYTQTPFLEDITIEFSMLPRYEDPMSVGRIEFNLVTLPRYLESPFLEDVTIEYTANVDNGFRLVIDKLTGGIRPPKAAKYRSKVFEINGFNPRVMGLDTTWLSGSQDFELEVRIYVAETLAEIKTATAPAYSTFHPAFSLGENLSTMKLDHPLHGRYAQVEYVFHRLEGETPSSKSMAISSFNLLVESEEFLASPSVSEATLQASTLTYRSSGSSVLLFDTKAHNTYYSKIWGMLHRPNGTAITLSTRSANTPEELEAQEWTLIPAGANSPQVGRFVQLKIDMITENGGLTPAIPKFELNYALDPDHVHLASLHKIKTDLIRYVFDTKILNQMNRSNLTSMYVDVFEDESGIEYRSGAMLVPLAEGKGYRISEGASSAEVISLTQGLPITPSRFIFSTYDKGSVEYDVSFDGGKSWIMNVRKDAQINIPLEKAGDELKIRARLLSEGAEISAWGAVF